MDPRDTFSQKSCVYMDRAARGSGIGRYNLDIKKTPPRQIQGGERLRGIRATDRRVGHAQFGNWSHD